MSRPSLTAQQCLRPLTRGEAGVATPGARGVVPAEPFCVVARWYQGNDAVGTPGYARASRADRLPTARTEARNRAAQANPGFSEANGYSIRVTTIDRTTKPGDYAVCKQAADAAGMNDAIDQFVF